MGTGGVYEIVNTVNGKRYIGSSVNLVRRWGSHRRLLLRGKHHSVHLQRAWDKHGEQAFLFRPLMLCIDTNLREWEKQYLQEFRPEYNVSQDVFAPMQGRKHTSETKKKMSKRALGNTNALGVKKSPETLIKMSKSLKGRVMGSQSAEHRAKLGDANRGKKHSPETLIKMSESHTGKKREPFSPEWIENMRISSARRWTRVRVAKAYERLMQVAWAGA